jgi:hypothetical protein
MSALTFIFFRSAKNSLLELRRKPKKLVLYLILVLIFGGLVALTFLSGSGDSPISDIVYFKGILFAFFLMYFAVAIVSGLSQGSSLFGMDDVNFLFVSPVNPRSILVYGIFKTAKTMAVTGIFILFQASTLRMYGIGAGGLLVLYAGYLLTQVSMQFLSLLIYSATNGNKTRRQLVRFVAILIFVPVAAAFLRGLISTGGDFLETLRFAVDSPAFSFTPVTGWAAEGMVALMTGEAAKGALYLGLIALVGIISVAVIYIGNPDYYEDVLVASETLFEQRRNMAEGKVNSYEQGSKRKIKIKGTGIYGQGASAFFGKHLRESFRANRFGPLGMQTVGLTAAAAVYALIMKQSIGSVENAGTIAMATLLGAMMWLKIFLVGTGRGLKETYSHYIYMAPESPFKKMLWGNAEFMANALIEGTLISVAAGLITGVSPGVMVFSALTYTIFIYMLVAVNFAFMRYTGADVSAGAIIVIYMAGVLILMVPGVVIAAVAGVMAIGFTGGLAVLAGWELLVALAGFWIAKGVLHDCDMMMLRQTGKSME